MQSAHLPGFAQLNSRKTKKFQDLIVALFREDEGWVVLTFMTILICHKCGTGVVMVTPNAQRESLCCPGPCAGLGLSIEEAVDVAVRCMLCVCVCLCADSRLYTPGYQ